MHTFCSGRYCYWSRTRRGGTAAQNPTKSCGEHKMSNRKQTRLSKQATTENDPFTQHASGSFVMPAFKQLEPEEWRERETVKERPASKLVTLPNTGLGYVMLDAISGFGNQYLHLPHTCCSCFKQILERSAKERKKQQKTNMNDCVIPSTIYQKQMNRA